jgi:RHS repeat-associated protein
MEELSGPIGAGVVARSYTYGLQRISQNLSPAVTGSSAWTPSFYMYDGGGSVRQLTNSSGQVTDEYEYDAFGNSFTKSGTTPNNYLYRGEQYDPDLSLYYLRARYYNPDTGRFLSRDPEAGIALDPKSLHKYLYAGGDPVNASDPTGRFLFEDALIEGGSKESATTIALRRLGWQVAVCLLSAAVALEEILFGHPAIGAAGAVLSFAACWDAFPPPYLPIPPWWQ